MNMATIRTQRQQTQTIHRAICNGSQMTYGNNQEKWHYDEPAKLTIIREMATNVIDNDDER